MRRLSLSRAMVVVVALSAPQAGCLGFRVSGHGKPLRETPVPSVGDSGEYRSGRRHGVTVIPRRNPQSGSTERAAAVVSPPQPARGTGCVVCQCWVSQYTAGWCAALAARGIDAWARTASTAACSQRCPASEAGAPPGLSHGRLSLSLARDSPHTPPSPRPRAQAGATRQAHRDTAHRDSQAGGQVVCAEAGRKRHGDAEVQA